MLSVKSNSRAHGSSLPPLRKYYLHIASEVSFHTDDRGVMLGDLAAAHRRAVSLVWNYMRCDAEEQDMADASAFSRLAARTAMNQSATVWWPAHSAAAMFPSAEAGSAERSAFDQQHSPRFM